MTDALQIDLLPSLTYAAGTDIGLRREENQDAFGLLEAEQFRCFFVADGMGGAQGGAEASQLAIASIRGFLAGEISLNVDGVREALEAANRTIFERSLADSQLTGMGTTVVGLGFGSNGMLVCNVGDSRAFRIRGGKVGQMTLDHTLVQELVDAGTITEAQAERHPVAHMLTRSLGPSEVVSVDCWMYPEKPELGDVYVLCSDGLYNLVNPLEMAEIVVFNEGHDAISKLIDLANSAGGNDNITVLIVRIGPTSKVHVSQLAIERIPQHPVAEEVRAPLDQEGGGPQAGVGGSGMASASAEGVEQGGLHTAAFRALSGAFQSPEMWHVRTAVWDARNVVIGGGVGLVLLLCVWLFRPEQSVESTQPSSLGEQIGHSLPGARLVSASMKADIPRHRERRRSELQAELQLIQDILEKKRGVERDSSLLTYQRDFRTGQVRHRTAVLQLRQEVASLLEARRSMPASPASLVSFAESYEDMSPQVKAARDAANGPIWRLRQAVSASAGSPADGHLASLEREVIEVDHKLRAALTAEIGRRVLEGVQNMRSELGGELAAYVRGELIDRLLKGGGEFDRVEGALDQYRAELSSLLAAK